MLLLLTHSDRLLGHEMVFTEVIKPSTKSMSGLKDATRNYTAYGGIVVEHLTLEDGDLVALEGHYPNRKWIAFQQSETYHINSCIITGYALVRSESCVPGGLYS